MSRLLSRGRSNRDAERGRARRTIPAGAPSAADSARPLAPVAQFAARSARTSAACRVCGRTLLLGERSLGFFTESGDGPFDVCELCSPRASRYGLRPRPSTPDELADSARRRRGRLRISLRRRRSTPKYAAAALGSAAIPLALAAFNDSAHARTLAGLSKTLGSPRASVVPRSPADREVVLTVAWEIVWYQFLIRPDGIEANRGTYLSELPARWQHWNCVVLPTGSVTPPDPALTDHSDEVLA